MTLLLIALVSALGSTVNPWPRDAWFQTQYFLFGNFQGQDDYTPIAAPAVLYWLVHRLALVWHLDLAGEFYIASLVQNVLLCTSCCFVYFAARSLVARRIAGFSAIGLLLLVASTGLPQAFWSENLVLFLMSAVLLIAVVLLRRAGGSTFEFRILTLLGGLSIAALVLTRMTPIFLIPGLALLFYRRMPLTKVASFTLVAAALTTVLMVATIFANHDRFGRYEITNSSGRHLWQGVKTFADSALRNSAQYQELKKLDPHIKGKDWWRLPIDDEEDASDHAESVIKPLAKEAIAREPFRYLLEGIKKFVKTIGVAPYRLGYGTFDGHWNPLNRDDFLPSLLELGTGPASTRAVAAILQIVHRIALATYPVTIFFILLTYADMVIGRWSFAMRARPSRLVGLLAGIPLLVISLWGLGLSYTTAVAGASCLLLWYVLATRSTRAARSTRDAHHADGASADFALYTFFGLMFFGSLWFSWQVEVMNSRNTLPYLPFWAMMLCMAANRWSARGA